MPVPALVARPFLLPSPGSLLAFLVFVVPGPAIGYLAFMLYGDHVEWISPGMAYIFGGGPAATCAVISLLAWHRLRRPLYRLLAAAPIGAFSGVVGMVPAYWLFFGRSGPTPDDTWLLQLLFGFSIVLSIIAALACTALIEAGRLACKRAWPRR